MPKFFFEINFLCFGIDSVFGLSEAFADRS